MLSRFHLIPERKERTDGRTDRFAILISRVSMLTRDKNDNCVREVNYYYICRNIKRLILDSIELFAKIR